MKNKNGFTLAEVLITIVALGIIAVVVVPSIINNYQKRLTITKLKKAYATLEVAATNLAANTGCLGKNVECTGLLETYTNNSSSALTQKFFELSGMKVNKKSSSTIWFKSISYNSLNDSQKAYAARVAYYIWTDKNDIGYAIYNAKKSSAGNPDGFLVTVYTNPKFNTRKEEMISNTDGSTSERNVSTEIKEGYNVFQFIIYDNFIVEPIVKTGGGGSVPLSKAPNSANIINACNPKYSGNFYGTSCAARIIKDGWKINY